MFYYIWLPGQAQLRAMQKLVPINAGLQSTLTSCLGNLQGIECFFKLRIRQVLAIGPVAYIHAYGRCWTFCMH